MFQVETDFYVVRNEALVQQNIQSVGPVWSRAVSERSRVNPSVDLRAPSFWNPGPTSQPNIVA